MGFPTRSSRYVLREFLLLVIAVAAAFVFINHDNLYLNHPFRLADARIESYLLASVVIYLFLRVAIIALEMRPPRPADGLLRCPECGQWIDVRSADGLAAHHRIALTPKPSPKEIVSAVALRKAVDAARFGPLAPRVETGNERTPEIPILENLTGQELLEALHDPDFVERIRHSPQRPLDRDLKR